MFTPLQMGTNHMLGVDNWVPLLQQNFEVRVYNMDQSRLTATPRAIRYVPTPDSSGISVLISAAVAASFFLHFSTFEKT